MQVMCMGCRQTMEMDEPKTSIVNQPSASIVLVEHPQQTMCPHCRQTVTVFVAGVNLTLVAAVVPAEEQKRIILASGPIQ